MNAQGIMWGSLVKRHGQDQILKVENVYGPSGLFDLVTIDGTEQRTSRMLGLFLEPIPLTEDWLLKLGFEKRLGVPDYFIGDRLKGNDFRINFSRNPVLIEFNYKELIDVKIQYVHQLMNLIFALTEIELELKA